MTHFIIDRRATCNRHDRNKQDVEAVAARRRLVLKFCTRYALRWCMILMYICGVEAVLVLIMWYFQLGRNIRYLSLVETLTVDTVSHPRLLISVPLNTQHLEVVPTCTVAKP